MEARLTTLPGVITFLPDRTHRDERGLFTRTFDASLAAAHDIVFGPLTQDSQSRSMPGVLRGLHGRSGKGEVKLVRVAAGAILDVIVDARLDSPTFGQHIELVLDDQDFVSVFIPVGFLHGFQVISQTPADVIYRIDPGHRPSEDVTVRYDCPELGIAWRPGTPIISVRDAAAGSWADLVAASHAARSSASSTPRS
jgi:dTDP-4-dehydrorhamnose 3,5-epimerase